MTERNSKTVFTGEELRKIISLVSELENSERNKQKGIRQRIRNIGLYWKEVGRGMSYTVSNLQRLFEDGTLSLDDKTMDELSKIKADSSDNQSKASENASLRFPVEMKGRKKSDEYYIIDLCDEILGLTALRQYRFDFLRGDRGTPLPVDAYYPDLKLVIEYNESQHTVSTPFFDNRLTVSGVSRGEQRRIYDMRRREVLPKHGIKLVTISYSDFGATKRLAREKIDDMTVIRNIRYDAGIINK